MSKKLPKTSAKAAHAEVLQHFLPTQLLPDEDPETHAALRDAILLDLMPGTPYATGACATACSWLNTAANPWARFRKGKSDGWMTFSRHQPKVLKT